MFYEGFITGIIEFDGLGLIVRVSISKSLWLGNDCG